MVRRIKRQTSFSYQSLRMLLSKQKYLNCSPHYISVSLRSSWWQKRWRVITWISHQCINYAESRGRAGSVVGLSVIIWKLTPPHSTPPTLPIRPGTGSWLTGRSYHHHQQPQDTSSTSTTECNPSTEFFSYFLDGIVKRHVFLLKILLVFVVHLNLYLKNPRLNHFTFYLSYLSSSSLIYSGLRSPLYKLK